MQLEGEFRSGYAALIGRPNVGKSTLINQLLNFKLSIVTAKPQTTRKKVLGILSGDDYQIIFVDTPGMIDPKYNLQKIMMNYLDHAIQDADVIVYLVDASSARHDFDALENGLLPVHRPVILALNKIDLVQKDKILPLIDGYRKYYNFQAYVPVSALKNDGLDFLVKEIVHSLPANPPYFPPEYVTDQQERFFVSEIVREKIFQQFGEEIPYSCHVQIEEFKEQAGKKDYIRAVIFVDRLSQKGILIGKQGLSLKKLGESARWEIEQFLGRSVFLELYVKVMENWRKKPGKLKSLGY